MSQFLCLHVAIQGLKTGVWRRFALRGDASLLDLHLAIRDFGWIGLGGWEMMSRSGRFLAGHDPEHHLWPGLETKAPLGRVLRQQGDELNYVYDLEERFEHRVRCEGRIAGPSGSRRSLFAGSGSFPPEGCGGALGFQRLLDQLQETPEVLSEDCRALLGNWSPGDFHLESLREAWDREIFDAPDHSRGDYEEALNLDQPGLFGALRSGRESEIQKIIHQMSQQLIQD